MANINNAVIHLYPDSPYICKACVNLREGGKIRFRLPLKNKEACMQFVLRHYEGLPVKIIQHN